MTTLTIPPKLMKRFQTKLAGGMKDMLDKLDVLSAPEGQSFTRPPTLTHAQKRALEEIDTVGHIISANSYPRQAGRYGFPAVPARVTLTGDCGVTTLPLDIWDSLIKDGWIDSTGQVTAQYINVA